MNWLGTPDLWNADDAANASLELIDGHVRVRCPGEPLETVVLRWNVELPAGIRILGDHWERGYGDLEWRGVVPERVLPWYVLVFDPTTGMTRGLGVMTRPSAIASWHVDQLGISLVLDVRAGGFGVHLGDRTLDACTLVERTSEPGENAFAFAQRFCRALCPAPRLPSEPVYGANDWYHRYGTISDATVREDVLVLASLTEGLKNPPTYVIDAGWFHARGCNGGPYETGNVDFPDMRGLAEWMRAQGIRPGIWIRPLLTTAEVPEHWCMQEGHPLWGEPGNYLDPSVPEVLDHVRQDIERLKDWGFELIKHDFTTWDITGRWGFEMKQEMTRSGWAFRDKTRTTAEIILGLYDAIREAAGDVLLIRCNTVGHLAAGTHELQRTGDDTSGIQWERTRKMGVNTLAFRMPQHRAFFEADADCVGLTLENPWDLNKQWLDVLATSGTPLFVSVTPEVIGEAERSALIDAFRLASEVREPSEPLDWMDTTCPRVWKTQDGTRKYAWQEPVVGFPPDCM